MGKLSTIINEIKDGSILLPDFQRKFVWNEIEMQSKLVASVLACLPIGSYLLLEGKPKDFLSKKIGSKVKYIVTGEEDRNYLLDGQQRVTVLANAFSNIIFDNLGPLTNLASSSLKNRFLLEFKDVYNPILYDDIFGLSFFKFPFSPERGGKPLFQSEQVLNKIVCVLPNTDPYKIFNPKYDLEDPGKVLLLKDGCQNDGTFWIPLYLLTYPNARIYESIIDSIVCARKQFLIGSFKNAYRDNKVPEFRNHFKDKGTEADIKNFRSEKNFEKFINNLGDVWSSTFIRYLSNCLEEIQFERILVKNSERGRAIDIYENLNRGGVSLSTFDLIVAKVARRDLNFVENMNKIIREDISVPVFLRIHSITETKWSTGLRMKVIDENREQFSNIYINVFLNLLSLVSYVSDLKNPDLIKAEYIKREKVLSLDANSIYVKYEGVVRALNKALLFLQSNCGIRTIDDIAYEHMLLGIAYILYIDESHFICQQTINTLEFWYWSSIFSGEYNSNQSEQIIIDLKLLVSVVCKSEENEILKNRKEKVLGKELYSDILTLLHKHVRFEKYPKDSIKKAILQYVLARKPFDLCKKDGVNVTITAWGPESLEIHHIIPLKNQHTLESSSLKLRRDRGDMLNSPLNLTFITKRANSLISCLAPSVYLSQISTDAIASHFITSITEADFYNPEQWLSDRYTILKLNLEERLRDISNHLI